MKPSPVLPAAPLHSGRRDQVIRRPLEPQPEPGNLREEEERSDGRELDF